MNTNDVSRLWIARLLAVSSVGFFWALPLSPFVSIAALSATKGAPATPRRKLAIAGAILCATLTALAAAVVGWQAIQLWR